MSKSPKFVVDCADHAGFVRLANGDKTILTRANKSSTQKEDYTEATSGDVLELFDIETGNKVLARVESMQFFESISELFNKSDIADETFEKKFENEQELRAEYEKNRPGYTKLLDDNGIVAWRIELIE
ncbi:MAG: hypothetical protein AAB436_02640 [Patescibacteria group bacterium]